MPQWYKLSNAFDAREKDNEYKFELDGTNYLLRLRWFARLGDWRVDVSTEDGELILPAKRLSPGEIISRGSLDIPGALLCIGPDPYDQFSLGKSLVLYWVDLEA